MTKTLMRKTCLGPFTPRRPGATEPHPSFCHPSFCHPSFCHTSFRHAPPTFEPDSVAGSGRVAREGGPAPTPWIGRIRLIGHIRHRTMSQGATTLAAKRRHGIAVGGSPQIDMAPAHRSIGSSPQTEISGPRPNVRANAHVSGPPKKLNHPASITPTFNGAGGAFLRSLEPAPWLLRLSE